MSRIVKALGAGLLGMAALWAATACFNWGFTELSEARQIDRLPMTPIASLAGGPYAVSGVIEADGGMLEAPYSNASVVYVRYRLEEEYRDSDGDRRTRTLDSGERSALFRLIDHSGEVRINPTLSTGQINWSVDQTYRRQDGDLIYTEWTLRPGQSVELLGRYQPREQALVFNNLGFNLPPTITDNNLKAEGGESLLIAAALISLASGAASVGLALILIAVQIHRFWIYVLTMTVVLVGYFWTTGVIHLERDWQRAAELYQTRAEAIEQAGATEARQADLYAMRWLIERGAGQWPDRAFFEPLASERFPIPADIDQDRQMIIGQALASEPVSRFEGVWLAWLITAAAIILGLIGMWVAIRAIKLKRLIEHLPTAKTTGLAYGMAELAGDIRVDDERPHVISRLAQEPCVAYDYSIEERRGSGKKARWVTVESGGEQTPFWLSDDAGQTTVYPDKANIDYPEKYRRREGRRRYTEHWLPYDRTAYCLGFAGLDRQHPDRLALQYEDGNPFLITTDDEDSVVRGKGAFGFLLTSVSLGGFLLAGTALLAASGQLTPADLMITALIVPVFLLVYTAILHYNDLVFLKNRAEKAWSDINTVLQKRHNLWPSLQRSVEAYLSHENNLLEAIGQIRAARPDPDQSPDQVDERARFEHKLTRTLQARVEDYPDLKGNEVVEQFMQQMEETEDYLALLRKGYSDAVEVYNTRSQSFPDVILARLFRFRAKQPFAITRRETE